MATAKSKKGTAKAQEDRAVDLADISELELNALPDEITAKAQELTNKNLKLEEQIELVKAQTDEKRRASGLKILQRRHLNNKLAIQKLLSPYIQDLAKAKAANEAGKFAQQTALKMIPNPAAKKPPEPKGGIDNWDFLTGIGIGKEDLSLIHI